MKKILFQLICFSSLLAGFNSCSNDYDMPDLSNACPMYHVGEIPNDVKSSWKDIAREYGLTFEVASEKWESVVEELDNNDNVIYSGVARGRADHNATKLKVGYVCKCRISTIDNNYYEVCTFWLNNIYELHISPIIVEVNMTSSSSYTVKAASDSQKRYPYDLTWDGSVTSLMINTTEQVGYEISGTEKEVVEKDSNGNVIYQGAPKGNSATGYITHAGTATMDVLILFFGWPKGTYNNKTHVGTITFPNIKMSANAKIVLNADMDYTIETYVNK